MRKGLATGFLLVCALVAVYLAAAPTAAVSAAAPRFTAGRADDVSVFEPDVERVALTSRDRPLRVADEPQWSAVPIVADEAAALLEQLVIAERAVRDPSVTGGKLAFMGHLQQLVYRHLIERPDLRDAVFAGIPPDLRGVADLNIAASADLYLFGPVRVTELPEWRIVRAPSIDLLMTYYKEAEAEFGVPWYYIAAINLVETRMGRIRGDSYAGAQGPMQFMPATWDMYGAGDINDTHDAILAAGRYLRATGAPERIERAIWMYNHDPEYVDAVMKYADVMRTDPSAYRGYHGWQVYFMTANGTFLLPEGWSKN
jgi:soluble lytic murein transglycosylase-like protein